MNHSIFNAPPSEAELMPDTFFTPDLCGFAGSDAAKNLANNWASHLKTLTTEKSPLDIHALTQDVDEVIRNLLRWKKYVLNLPSWYKLISLLYKHEQAALAESIKTCIQNDNSKEGFKLIEGTPKNLLNRSDIRSAIQEIREVLNDPNPH